ncbi:MAG: glycosyltransferase [Prolixibacteraceae bacterium]
MNLGFVFTNYNSTRFTEELIASLNAQDMPAKFPVVIVDNNSAPEHVNRLKKIKEEHENVHILLNNVNLGYFKGLNVGIQYLKENLQETDHIVIGNNDLIFPENFNRILIGEEHLFKHYPVISPNIITLDGEHQNPHVIKSVSKFREFIYDLYFTNYNLAITIRKIAKITKRYTDRKDEKQHEIAQTIYQGYGACYILGPLFFKNFSSLWAPSFLMNEEVFLSKQLESKNFKVFYDPAVIVKHQLHSSVGEVPDKKKWHIARESHKEYRKYVKVWK